MDEKKQARFNEILSIFQDYKARGGANADEILDAINKYGGQVFAIKKPKEEEVKPDDGNIQNDA